MPPIPPRAKEESSEPVFDVDHLCADAATYNIPLVHLKVILTAAVVAKSRAYCPYSNFRVGAALLVGNEHRVYKGSNVENAAYPVGLCAERVAGSSAVTDRGLASEEQKEEAQRWTALAVATDGDECASPCGMCRQFIREFAELDLPIFMINGKNEWVAKTLGELLPMSFGPENLRPKVGATHSKNEL